MSDFTVAIATKNSSGTMSMVLNYLCNSAEGDLKVLIADNESGDGTFEMLGAQAKNNIWKNHNKLSQLDISLRQAGRVAGDRTTNIPYMRRFLSSHVMTDYIFWLDSDVILCAPKCLSIMFEEFKKRKELGIYGIRYEPRADHVKIGASFMETKLARKLNWKIDDKCECRNAHIELGPLGLGSDHHEVFTGRHLKIL